ncbi:MAG: hypothetical protein F6K04_21115, partial [Leptolyngbya sp. SIO4C5]|nr:hypothetical protein [Leptolyngbya sp. SIO4C5]
PGRRARRGQHQGGSRQSPGNGPRVDGLKLWRARSGTKRQDVQKTGLATGTVLSALTQLEILKLVSHLPGMHYQRRL